MGIFKRLFKGKVKSSPLINGTLSFTGFDHSSDIKALSGYKDSLYLYIGVSMIAKRVAGIPLELYRIKNKRGDVVEVLDHPLLSLLAKPNQLQTSRQFMEMSVAHYLLSGEAFWYMERNGSTITSITPLRPDYVEVVLNPDQTAVIAYEYHASKVYKFAPEDVLHIRNVDPENPLRGVGVVRPARSRVMSEIEATKYQAGFFKNQGRPDTVVFADQVVTEEQGDDFRARWKRIFGGGNAGQVGIFGSNVKSMETLNKTPKEMDFIESQKFLRADILSALHIPEEMVSSDGSNRATSKEAYKMYLQEAVIPVLEAFIDGVNNWLLPAMDMNVFMTFQDPVPVDREMLLKEATELKKAGIITANEGRELFNYEPMEGHDELSAAPEAPSAAITDQAKAILRTRPLLVKKFNAVEKTVKALQRNEPPRQMNSIFATRQLKEAYAKAFNDRADRKAETLADAINEYHDGLLKRILATDLGLSTFMDKQSEKITARNAFMPIIEKLYKEGGQAALDAIFKKSTDFFVFDEYMASLQARVYFFTDSMTETTHEILRDKISTGLVNGDSVQVISDRLREYFVEMGQKRALTIARTETGFALSKATNDAYMQSSVVTGKEWITVGDDKVREEHRANDGKIVAKNVAFPSGEHYPGEHSVNCRCVLAPAV